MIYKNIEFGNCKLKFHRGINAISTEDRFVFDMLSMPLQHISKLYDTKFSIVTNSEEFYGAYSNIRTVFEFSDRSFYELFIELNNSGETSNCWFKDNKNLVQDIIKKDGKFPIFMYCNGDTYLNNSPYDQDFFEQMIELPYNMSNNFPRYNFINDCQFFMNMAINANYVKKEEYSIFHYNLFKQIMNEYLSINHFEDFDFYFHIGKFGFNNGSNINNIDTDLYGIGITTGMLMHLYRECLIRKEKDYIGNPCDEKGIVIFNFNFSERASYSDKKWKYYELFNHYFPNIQFIVC